MATYVLVLNIVSPFSNVETEHVSIVPLHCQDGMSFVKLLAKDLPLPPSTLNILMSGMRHVGFLSIYNKANI